MVEVPERGDELLGVEAVARYLEVQPVTIYRWCREGRLPCLKLGKAWRVRRSSLDEFLRRAERRRTLVEHLATFLTVPDQVVAVAEDEALLSRLDAAFLQVGEARDGVLVKYYGGETRPLAELRAGFARHGLAVDRLEAEGRFRWSPEVDPARGRDATLRRLMAEEATAGRTVWVSFDWTREVDLEAALRQQEALAGLVDAHPLVVKTGVLEAVADEWSPAAQRRLLGAGRGQLRLTRAGLVLARAVPLPEP